jgi:hypothetical protein
MISTGRIAVAQDSLLTAKNKVPIKVETMSADIYIYLFDPQSYEERLLPAYKAFVDKGVSDALVRLLKDAIPRLATVARGYGEPELSTKSYEESIAILTGKQYYSSQGKQRNAGEVTTREDLRSLVDNSIAPDLLQVYCIPRNLGVNPEQSMSRKALAEYLYSQSRWIEDYFTGSRQVTGPVPEIKLGEFSQFFSSEEIEAFDKELLRLRRPTDDAALADSFDNLRTLVHIAATKPTFRLLYVYM